MKIQRAWMISLSMMAVFVAAVSPAQGQFPTPHPTPGYHPAAHPYQIMMGQEGYDPTWIGANNYGDTCCGPNWYDFLIEWSYMKRDDAGRNVPFTSDGIAGLAPPNIVLQSSDLDFDYDSGLRAFARYQCSAVHNIEVGFLGAIEWHAFASAFSDNHSLYSAFSDFGNTPFGGFANDVDQATRHSIDYRSDLDTVELNIRRSWASPTYRVHGSWLAGARYVRVHEAFHFSSLVLLHEDDTVDPPVLRGPGQADYLTTTKNDLIGFQLGGDLGVCILPGLNLAGEMKAGVYGNQAEQDTVLGSTSLPRVVESADSSDAAFVAEAGAYLMYQVHPLLKLRAGYQFFFVDGLALAPENFNSEPPIQGIPRAVTINDNGNMFFHGSTVGIEFGW